MKLTDFKGEKAIDVVGRLLIPIMNMVGNPKNQSADVRENVFTMLSAFFRNNPKDVLEMLAIMDDVPVETYDIDGQKALLKLFAIFDDPELLGLFGLQSETVTSSGSATTITTE